MKIRKSPWSVRYMKTVPVTAKENDRYYEFQVLTINLFAETPVPQSQHEASPLDIVCVVDNNEGGEPNV